MDGFSIIQALVDERPDLLAKVLTFLNATDVARFSMTSSTLNRVVQREMCIWDSILAQNTTILPYLGIPKCFSSKKKVQRSSPFIFLFFFFTTFFKGEACNRGA